VAYKKDIDDVRESPSLDVIRLLEERGATVIYNDPYVADLHHERIELTSVDLTDETLRASDCVVVVTDHTSYDWEHIANTAAIIVDSRNALKRVESHTATIVGL
jgi:UDP-N-acetyl-D-glucosamine dehydrogenase